MKISKKMGKKVANILKNDRTKREKIAKTLGIPANELVEILEGKRKMTEENLENISTSFDTPLEDFVDKSKTSSLVGKIMEKAGRESNNEEQSVVGKTVTKIIENK